MMYVLQNLYDSLFAAQYLSPHGFCLLWDPALIWLHVSSDLVIALAYYSIPVALAYIVWKRADIAFGWLFWMFAAFILACGTTHVFSVWTLWRPDYGIEGIVKLLTAIVSISTAMALWPLVPRITALPSPVQLRRTNDALSQQVRENVASLEALRITQDRYRLLVQKTPMPVHWVDREMRIIDVNKRWLDLLGYTRDAILGRKLTDFMTPETAREYLNITWPILIGGGEVHERHCEFVRTTGELVSTLVSTGVEGDFRDGSFRAIEVLNDITARLKVERALVESEQRYRVLVEGVTDYVIIMLDPNGIVTNWNKGAEHIEGYRAEEVVGRHFSFFYTEEDRAADAPEHALEIAARDGRHETEALRVRKDGSLFWANVVIDALKDNNGRLIGFAKISRDITERLETARAREEARAASSQVQKLAAIQVVMDSIPALVWSSLPDGSVDFVSRRWLEFTGLSVEQALGWGYAAVIHPEDLARWRENRPARMAAAVPFEDEVRMRRADGEYRHVLTRIMPLLDESGSVLKWYGTATDIEDRKRVESLQAELERVGRLTTTAEVTASIAHEIIQPLIAIVTNGNTCLHWLDAKTFDLAKARSAAARAVRDAERASAIIVRIRALMTKSDSQRMAIDLNGLIVEVLTLIQYELANRQVLVNTVLAPALPPIFGDRVQLQQLILNLVMNGAEAMVATADRRKELTIETRVENDDQVLVSVRDLGEGLSPETAEKIFDPFYTTKPGGLGMGLAICRSIVEAHNGRIWVSPGSPRGALFQFTLPTNDLEPEDTP